MITQGQILIEKASQQQWEVVEEVDHDVGLLYKIRRIPDGAKNVIFQEEAEENYHVPENLEVLAGPWVIIKKEAPCFKDYQYVFTLRNTDTREETMLMYSMSEVPPAIMFAEKTKRNIYHYLNRTKP